MSQGVMAIAEQSDGIFRKVAFEALSAGRRIADRLGAELTAVVAGAGIETGSRELMKYGADKIIVAENERLKEYLTDAAIHVFAEIIAVEDPSVLVTGASTQGKDLAARLAARLQAPLVMDCVALRMDAGTLIATRPMYGGKVLADMVLEGTPQMIAIRPNAMAIVETPRDARVETRAVDAGKVDLNFIEKSINTDGAVDLTEADVIVSGGRGMNGPDFSLVEQLARELGGAVGATRTAVDEGWRPHADQVGQTGKVVSPNLYICCGISGAIQHLAGMRTSKVIVAINKDPDAPIFAKADYGIVGDLFEVLPELTEAIRRTK